MMRARQRGFIIDPFSGFGAAATGYEAEVIADTPHIWWKLDEASGTTFADASGGGRNGTGTGTMTLGSSPLFGEAGTGVTFGGGRIARASPFAVVTAITIEARFRIPTSLSGSDMYIAGRGQDASSNFGAALRVSSAGRLEWLVSNNSSIASNIISRGSLIAADTDYHAVGTWNGTTGVCQLVLNGVLVGRQIGVGGALRAATNDEAIVGQGVANGTGSTARIDDVVFYESSLTLARIQAHAAALGITIDNGPADANWSSVKLLIPGRYGTHDFSDSMRAIGQNGNAASTTARSKWGAASVYFDGAGDWLSTPSFTGALTGDFTVEGWWYGVGTHQTFARLFQSRTGDVTAGAEVFFNTPNGNSRLYISISTNGTSASTAADTGSNIGSGSWQHFAFVRTGTDLALYIGGTRVYNATVTSAALFEGQVWGIGGQSGTSRSVNASIEDFRVSSVSRYAAGASITVPTAAFPTRG